MTQGRARRSRLVRAFRLESDLELATTFVF
jgi:hypothetical protein